MIPIIYTLLISLFGLLLDFNHDPNIKAGLIAHYSFNQCDARDDSGNGSDGELFGGINCWCGIEDDGLLFDGRDDYVEFSGMVNQYFTTSDFTVSYYIKPERNTIFRQSLLAKRGDCDLHNMFDFTIDLNAQFIDTKVYEHPDKYYPEISPNIDPNGWIHIALVREGLYARTYINGVLEKEGFRCSGVDLTNSTKLSFSNSPCIENGSVRYFKGVLDELRVYDRALEAEEIMKLYELNPIENASMDCYAFNDKKMEWDRLIPSETAYICQAY